MHKTCSFYKLALKNYCDLYCLFMHRWKKRNIIFKVFCVLFILFLLVLFNLFLYSQAYPTKCEDAYTIPEGIFDKFVVLLLHLFVSPFRFISFSIQTFSQISDKNSMTISLLLKWTSTAASAGSNASLVHPVFWPTRSVDCLQIVARKIHTRSFCSSSLLRYNWPLHVQLDLWWI
jgi:hypothetical protein